MNQVKLTPKISIELGHDPLEDSEVAGSGPGSLGADTSGYLSGGWEIEADGGQEKCCNEYYLNRINKDLFHAELGGTDKMLRGTITKNNK